MTDTTPGDDTGHAPGSAAIIASLPRSRSSLLRFDSAPIAGLGDDPVARICTAAGLATLVRPGSHDFRELFHALQILSLHIQRRLAERDPARTPSAIDPVASISDRSLFMEWFRRPCPGAELPPSSPLRDPAKRARVRVPEDLLAGLAAGHRRLGAELIAALPAMAKPDLLGLSLSDPGAAASWGAHQRVAAMAALRGLERRIDAAIAAHPRLFAAR